MNSDVIKANLVSSDSAIQSLLEQRLDSIIPCESLPEKSIGLSTPAKHVIIQMAQIRKRGRPENPKVPKIQKFNKDGTERKEYTMLTDEQEDNLRAMAKIEHTTVEDIIAVFNVSRRNIKNIIDRQGKKIKKGGEVCRILTSDIRMIKQGFPQFTLKKLEICKLARNDQEILAKRVDYTLQHRVLKVTGTHLIYIDETGFLLTEMRSRGRPPIGERCNIHRRARRVEHISCISAVTYAFGVIQTTFVHGNVDSTIFCVFITSLLQTFQQFGIKKATAVMDNYPIHKTDAVLKMCKEANINIQYTPPYSCELNPVELVFDFFKHRVNVPVDVSSPSAIVLFLDAALRTVTQEEVASCISFVEEFVFPLAERKEQLSKNLAISHIKEKIASLEYISKIEIDGDGACLFNSIADLTDEDPFEFRQSSVDQMKKYPKLLGDIKFERNKFLYRRYMKKQNSWGGLREVRALSLYLGRRIFVHDPSKRLEAYDYGEDLDFHSALHIGLVNGNHFLSMRLQ
ncbi:MAG: hypothetical protein EZS28_022647 [Streblomastix strix]|uniref:OTU domain-containing protein n=1 Tax=Streblomastix strix TaxID=222440 RepID=A0A5J4VHK1_9EUKA|nr:MAG: hypothetical protein EZS28_022647 [Streblomastix strix]